MIWHSTAVCTAERFIDSHRTASATPRSDRRRGRQCCQKSGGGSGSAIVDRTLSAHLPTMVHLTV
eukprot:gene9767-biopygen382